MGDVVGGSEVEEFSAGGGVDDVGDDVDTLFFGQLEKFFPGVAADVLKFDSEFACQKIHIIDNETFGLAVLVEVVGRPVAFVVDPDTSLFLEICSLLGSEQNGFGFVGTVALVEGAEPIELIGR